MITTRSAGGRAFIDSRMWAKFIQLVKEGHIINMKDLCRQGICPVVISNMDLKPSDRHD